MCQLLGFSAEKPVGFSAVFREFRKRAAENPHAWGIALWSGDGRGPLVIRDPRPADKSPAAALLASKRVPGKTLIAHIRLGTTRGEGSLKTVTNAHPFCANIDGEDWAFAHNGFVSGVYENFWYRPHGTTDSEKVFGMLVRELHLTKALNREEKVKVIKRVAREHAGKGKLNFLLSDGEDLYFFSNAPGTLHYREMRNGKNGTRVVLVATRPIGKGSWKPCETGTLYTAHKGIVVRQDHVTVEEYAPKSRRQTESRAVLAPAFSEDVSDWRLYEQMSWSEIRKVTKAFPRGRHKSYIDYIEEELEKAVLRGAGRREELPVQVQAH